MANPLRLYVPILQTPEAQAAAQIIAANFATTAAAGLNKIGTVHYARVALIPNQGGVPGYYAVLLVTTFDGNMNSYLTDFWVNGNVEAAFESLMTIALDPVAQPITFNVFSNFINANNLNQPNELYAAYPQTVAQIWNEFPPVS
jgi:hypothetical protein